MAIVFYYTPMTSATRVHWALEELAVPYEKVRMDLREGDQRKADFLAINPNGKVPTLVDDGAPVFESLAIFIHLGERYGVAKKLWPAPGTREHAEALSWIVWGTVTAGADVFRLMQNTSERVPAEQRNALQADIARKDLAQRLGLLETKLDGHAWLVGGSFTLVDVANASMVAFAGQLGLDLQPFPRVRSWVERAMQRPAMAAATAG